MRKRVNSMVIAVILCGVLQLSVTVKGSVVSAPAIIDSFLENAPALVRTTVHCDAAQATPYLFEGVVTRVYAAFKAAEDMEVVLNVDGDATVRFLVAFEWLGDGYACGYDGDITKTQRVLPLCKGEILILCVAGEEKCNVVISPVDNQPMEVFDFTGTSAPVPSADAKWAWDAKRKELTLKDGFELHVPMSDPNSGAIVLPGGATVLIDGKVSLITDGVAIYGKGNLTVKSTNGSMYVAAETAMMAKRRLTVDALTIEGTGSFAADMDVAIRDTQIHMTGPALVETARDTEAAVVFADCDITFSGDRFTVTKTTELKNCVSHIVCKLPILAGDGFSPWVVKGGALTVKSLDRIDLDMIAADQAAALMVEGAITVKDTAALHWDTPVVFYDGTYTENTSVYAGEITAQQLLADPNDDFYWAVASVEGQPVLPKFLATAYAVDIAQVQADTDKETYAHNATITVKANELAPCIGVYGNTRLIPESWQVGELTGTFERGDDTVLFSAAELGAGIHTVTVSYRYESATVHQKDGSYMPFLETVWEEKDWKVRTPLTVDVTFRVLEKTVFVPAPLPNHSAPTPPVPAPSPIVAAPTGDTDMVWRWVVVNVCGAVLLTVTKKRKT